MIRIDSIKEADRDLIRQLFHEGNTKYVYSTATFEIIGDTIRCLSSMTETDNPRIDLVEINLRILRIKEISEGIGYSFIDLRKEINN